MLKKEIRKTYLSDRLHLTDEKLAELTNMILSDFENFQLPETAFFLSYYPLTNRQEFDVTRCDKMVIEKFPEAVCSWPVMDANGLDMDARTINKGVVQDRNPYNIPEPIDGEYIDPKKIDLVFVPLLAFDKKGYRVGYGKGFYDRFLKNCRQDVLKIGFSFFDPVESIDDLNDFDVPLNICFTPTSKYEF